MTLVIRPFLFPRNLEHFLSPRQCEDLMLLSDQNGCKEATVSFKEGAKMVKGVRNNYRSIYQGVSLAKKYWERLRVFCPQALDDSVAVGLNERFRFYKYASGQRFKRHIDGLFRRSAEEESRIAFMIYLNDDFTGGETNYVSQEIVEYINPFCIFSMSYIFILRRNRA